MNQEKLKETVIARLELADNDLISEVNELIISYEKNEIVGYSPDGIPIRKEQMLADLKIAEKQIEDRNYITAEELKKEIKKWQL